LNATRLLVKAWNLILNKLKGKKVSSRLIARSLKKANLPIEVRGFSIEQVQEKLKQAYQDYYCNKNQAASLRNTSLELLAEAIAVKGDLAHEKVLRDLRQREQQRATARKLRFIQGKMKSGSTTMIAVVGEDGNRVDITDRKEMERAILDNNKAKFSQSFHTPFYRSPLKEALDFKDSLTWPRQYLRACMKLMSLWTHILWKFYNNGRNLMRCDSSDRCQ